MSPSTSSLPRRRSRFGQISLMLVGGAVLLVLVAVVAVAFRRDSGADTASRQADQFIVRRGAFDITIPVTGELAALKQIEIRNLLDSRAVISEIVPEGTFVHAGDVLFRLNDDDVHTRVKDAQDAVNVAENNVRNCDANLAIKKSTRESDVEKAEVQITLAELALQAWQEGDDVSKHKQLDLDIETADKEYARLVKRFEDSGHLREQNFISDDEYRKDEVAMIQARAKVEQTKLDREVYEKYQRVESQKKLESDVAQAKAERIRVQQRSDAGVDSAQSDLESKQAQLASVKQKEQDLEEQLAHCTITAPSDGLVVYFASTQTGGMGRNEGRPPEVGTELARNELVIILPDTTKMVAAVKISEALVGQIQAGQRAAISCDAMPDRPLDAEVLSVGVMAESGGWRDPNRRDYTVKLRLLGANDLNLKPSMRCKAVISVGRVDDALHVPLQAILRNGPLTYVYVPDGSGFSQRKVSTGRSSELFMEITDGAKEGEIVLLREPAADEIIARLEVPKEMTQRSGAAGANASGDDAAGSQRPDAAGAGMTNGPASGMREGGPRPRMGEMNGAGQGPSSSNDHGGNGTPGRNRGNRRPPAGGGPAGGNTAPGEQSHGTADSKAPSTPPSSSR